MSFETVTESLFKRHVKKIEMGEYRYVEYGMDFVRIQENGGNMFEIRVREIKPRVKNQLIIKKG